MLTELELSNNTTSSWKVLVGAGEVKQYAASLIYNVSSSVHIVELEILVNASGVPGTCPVSMSSQNASVGLTSCCMIPLMSAVMLRELLEQIGTGTEAAPLRVTHMKRAV